MASIQILINGEETSKIYGLATADLIKVHQKLRAMDMELPDLLEFLDRDKVILFSEQLYKIQQLNDELIRLRLNISTVLQEKL